ncbi:hypothetical protein MHU86_16988 [Fragilaria crotonensis]|nr:hypothetical protein MHU86_16988 [Fragilaria crotonensis]
MAQSQQLRQRKQKDKSPSLTPTSRDQKTNVKTNAKVNAKGAEKNRLLLMVGALLVYFPILTLFNPITMPKWIAYWRRNNDVITGIDHCADSDASSCCINVDRLVFLRIPKTASTSLLEVFRPYTTVVDVGELEDVVSSLPITGTIAGPGGKNMLQGYHDPTLRRQRFHDYYKRASHHVLYTPHTKTLFEGHMGYFDFETLAPRFYPNTTSSTTTTTGRSILPDWILDLYNRKYPQAPLRIAQFTMIRHPEERLASMYHYDRYAARQEPWRRDFVKQRGNLTWDECWQSETCPIVNDFSKWCNLQTQLLCGTDCDRGDSELALEFAKQTLVDHLAVVGITERFEESPPTGIANPTLLSACTTDSFTTPSKRKSIGPNYHAVPVRSQIA